MFSFYAPARIRFGEGCRRELPAFLKKRGTRGMLVLSRSLTGFGEELISDCRREGLEVSLFVTERGEPTLASVESCAEAARCAGAEFLAALGGGSCLDTVKAAAGLAAESFPLRDYLEGVGIGRKLQAEPLPWVALPTTAGTGAEVTKNAVIACPEEGWKKSFRDERLYAAGVFLDPELMTGVPPRVTAESGMDALTQLLEALISRKSTPMTRDLALAGLRYAAVLPRVWAEGSDLRLRGQMALAALYSGLALANGGLGAVHGFAAALGSRFGIPHGRACAVFLPHILRVNLPACRPALEEAARILIGRSDPEALIEWIESLNRTFGIPEDLRFLGLSGAEAEQLVAAAHGNAFSGNPLELEDKAWLAEIRKLL